MKSSHWVESIRKETNYMVPVCLPHALPQALPTDLSQNLSAKQSLPRIIQTLPILGFE